jgi:hypothetical protein
MIHIPSPEELFKTDQPTEFYREVLERVSERLSDALWVRDCKRGTKENPYWTITVRGEASEGDKREIAHAFRSAGWPRVEMRNSFESGERGGFFFVTIYAKNDV